jgi:hypothetical protein
MRFNRMTPQTFTLADSPFWPVAIGFFGLGTGYFIWGGQALFGYPKASPEVDRTMGMWGFWMPGFCQFLTGVYLIVGLTWFNVFGNAAPLYMAGVGFTVYGIHWFAIAHRRYAGSSAAPDGWMAIAYLFVSVLGAYVFSHAGDVPVMIVFIGLTLIYLVEVPTRFGGMGRGRTARSAAPMPHRNLAYVLHVGGHCKYCPGLQALDITRNRGQFRC